MLSKEGFCKALQMIKEQESIDEQFSKALNLVGDGHFVKRFPFSNPVTPVSKMGTFHLSSVAEKNSASY